MGYFLALCFLIGGLVYVYKRHLVDYGRLYATEAEIEKIKIPYMIAATSSETTYTVSGRGAGPSDSTISIPEILIHYRYRYEDREYTGNHYVLLTSFLNEVPFKLDFESFGSDFPVLTLPGGRYVGEEQIEDYLLSIQSTIPVLVYRNNPRLSVLPEGEA